MYHFADPRCAARIFSLSLSKASETPPLPPKAPVTNAHFHIKVRAAPARIDRGAHQGILKLRNLRNMSKWSRHPSQWTSLRESAAAVGARFSVSLFALFFPRALFQRDETPFCRVNADDGAAGGAGRHVETAPRRLSPTFCSCIFTERKVYSRARSLFLSLSFFSSLRNAKSLRGRAACAGTPTSCARCTTFSSTCMS